MTLPLVARWKELGRLFAGIWGRRRARRQLAHYHSLFPGCPAGRLHDLPAELVVSLTSYAPRFATLACTLDSLFSQTIKPDRIVLWIAHHERTLLPREIVCREGLQIEFVDDLRSYKKLVFALDHFPDAFIATCDDDVFYPPYWLEQLVAGYDDAAPTIVCHRAHRLRHDPAHGVAPYRSWEWDVQDEAARQPSGDLMPTGVAGVLYYPGCLHPDVRDRSLFNSLCPDADDLWFFWQARRAGTLYRKVGDKFPRLYWDGTQEERLFNTNDSGNDLQVQRLWEYFGAPGREAAECAANA